jgi:hypothetical protein
MTLLAAQAPLTIMLQPHFEVIQREKARGKRGVSYYGRFLHPNPKFWKYYFYFFTDAAEKEGEDFFCVENRLCISSYKKRVATFDREEDLAFVYNQRHPRRGSETPFDESHERWEDVEWAPPLNEDPDPKVEEGFR